MNDHTERRTTDPVDLRPAFGFSDPAALAGLPVYTNRHQERGIAYVASTTYGGTAVHMHWIDASMMTFDHDLWWAETPAQTARRIVNEVLRMHGFDPLPDITDQPSDDGGDA